MNNENGFPAKSTVLNLLNLDIPILVLLWYNKLNFSKQKQFIHADPDVGDQRCQDEIPYRS